MNKRTNEAGFFRTRRDQIEAEDVGRCLSIKTRSAMKEALMAVALVAACGERDRTLELLRSRGLHEVADAVCETPILKVLGY